MMDITFKTRDLVVLHKKAVNPEDIDGIPSSVLKHDAIIISSENLEDFDAT